MALVQSLAQLNSYYMQFTIGQLQNTMMMRLKSQLRSSSLVQV